MSDKRVVVTCLDELCQVEGEIIFLLSSRGAVIILGNVVYYFSVVIDYCMDHISATMA